MARTIDPRQVLTGADGRLYFGADRTFLAHVNRFSINLRMVNASLQPVGQKLIGSVPTGFQAVLTMSEIVVANISRTLIDQLFADMQSGCGSYFDFHGVLKQPGVTGGADFDGRATLEQVVLKDCVPDGDVQLMDLQSGQVIERAWTFLSNDLPILI